MKLIHIIIIITFFCSCNRGKLEQLIHDYEKNPLLDTIPITVRYALSPDESDSICIQDIERAKTDIKRGKIVFTQATGFLYGNLRYEQELRQLCEEYNLDFDYDVRTCIIFEGQTQGCYGYYMDYIIIEKFGTGFKEKLHEKADSMFLINSINDTVKYWDCDERPRLPDKDSTCDELPKIKVADSISVAIHSFIDLGFIIDTDSTISGFYINNIIYQDTYNTKLKELLFKVAVHEVKSRYPVWVPGKIRGVSVRTDNNVRIYFENN